MGTTPEKSTTLYNTRMFHTSCLLSVYIIYLTAIYSIDPFFPMNFSKKKLCKKWHKPSHNIWVTFCQMFKNFEFEKFLDIWKKVPQILWKGKKYIKSTRAPKSEIMKNIFFMTSFCAIMIQSYTWYFLPFYLAHWYFRYFCNVLYYFALFLVLFTLFMRK